MVKNKVRRIVAADQDGIFAYLAVETITPLQIAELAIEIGSRRDRKGVGIHAELDPADDQEIIGLLRANKLDAAMTTLTTKGSCKVACDPSQPGHCETSEGDWRKVSLGSKSSTIVS